MSVRPQKIHGRSFAQVSLDILRDDALDLLEWALTDVSPDPKHPIRIKMGIEREGNFVPDTFKERGALSPEMRGEIMGEYIEDMKRSGGKIEYPIPEELFEAYLKKRNICSFAVQNDAMFALRDALRVHLQKHFPDTYANVHLEDSGAFIVEPSTKPLPPKKAVKAMGAMCDDMIQEARKLGFTGCFGTLPLPYMKGREAHYRHLVEGEEFPPLEDQVFTSKDGPQLVGRGQHVSVSLWAGDKNIFCTPDDEQPDDHMLTGWPKWIMKVASNMLPSMIMLTRRGNYYKIAANRGLAVTEIAPGFGKDSHCALNLRSAGYDEPLVPESVRMEFRQAAPDADPMDAALAAAIPTTKAFLDNVFLDDNGKAKLNDEGLPKFDEGKFLPSKRSNMPTTHEMAVKLFNDPNNRNFLYLNELAERKIARAKAEANGLAGGEMVRQAEKLRNIGTKLHEAYCLAYGMASRMPKPAPEPGLS